MSDLVMRPAGAADLPVLQQVRASAFAPIFASFRSLLGDELYNLVQARDDAAQKDLLETLVSPDSGWEMHIAESEGAIVGFVAIQMNRETGVGEIGLNAVDPAWAGRGIGTAMYEFVLTRMRQEGMRAATVSTGGDASHEPARRAYEKAGFVSHIPSVWLCRTL